MRICDESLSNKQDCQSEIKEKKRKEKTIFVAIFGKRKDKSLKASIIDNMELHIIEELGVST